MVFLFDYVFEFGVVVFEIGYDLRFWGFFKCVGDDVYGFRRLRFDLRTKVRVVGFEEFG